MIESIEMRNFRGFSHLVMDDVKPITLISGMNNVGKSSILDGLFLFFDHVAPESFVKLNGFRGFPSLSEPKYLWEPVFYNMDTRNDIQIKLRMEQKTAELRYGRDDAYVVPKDADVPPNVRDQFISSTQFSYTLKFQYRYDGYEEYGHFITSASGLLRNVNTSLERNQIRPLSFTRFINSVLIQNGDIATLLGELELDNKKADLIKILRLIEPSITDITTIITKNGGAQIYIKTNERLLPIKLPGYGLNKLLYIITSIMTHPNSLMLIDEIETGIHYSAYVDFWKVVAATAQKYCCQIIATTHSYECIVSAANGLKEVSLSDLFCYFRVDREKEETRAYRYSNELLRAAIDTNLEVR